MLCEEASLRRIEFFPIPGTCCSLDGGDYVRADSVFLYNLYLDRGFGFSSVSVYTCSENVILMGV